MSEINWTHKDLGPVDAYAEAVEAGYTGTRAEWLLEVGSVKENALAAERSAEGAAGSAEDAAESAEEAAGSALSAAASAADALEHTQGVIENWLEENIDPESGYALDRTLTLSNAATPADITGSLKSAFVQETEDNIGSNYNLFTREGEKANNCINPANGNYVARTNWYASDYIAVTAGENYYINFSYYGSGIYGMAYYDSTKTFLTNGGTDQSNTTETGRAVFEFTPPTGACYIRFSYAEGVFPISEIYVGKGKASECYPICKDMFSLSEYEAKKINSDGTITADAGYTALKIDLEGVRYVLVSNYRYSGGSNKTISFFNAGGTVLESYGQMTATPAYVKNIYTVPFNAAYCYVSTRNNDRYELIAKCYGNIVSAINIIKNDTDKLIGTTDLINDTLADAGITEIKNLMQGISLSSGRINTSTGNVDAATGMTASGFIPVDANKQYYINFSYYSGGDYGICYYDESKTRISGAKQSNTTKTNFEVFSFTTPANTKYIRISIPDTMYGFTYDPVVAEVNPLSNLYQYQYPYYESDLMGVHIGSNGEISADSTFRTQKIDVKKSKYIRVINNRYSANSYKTIAFYQADGTFIIDGGAMTSALERVNELFIVPSNASYCYVSERITSAIYYMSIVLYTKKLTEIVEQKQKDMMQWFFDDSSIKRHEYFGEKITIQNNFSSVLYGRDVIKGATGSISEPSERLLQQDCAVYGNYLFNFADHGYCRVYDISDMNNIQYVNEFELEGYGTSIHCSCISFAPVIRSGDTYPLLYTNKNLGDNVCACIVEKVTLSSAELIQTINFNESFGFTNMFTVWIGDDGYLYAEYHNPGASFASFYKFNAPSTTSETITLGETDVVDSWTEEDADYITNVFQTCMTKNGKIYALLGDSNNRKYINVYDIQTHNRVSHVPLDDVLSHEPEGMAAYKNGLLITVNDSTVTYSGIYWMHF